MQNIEENVTHRKPLTLKILKGYAPGYVEEFLDDGCLRLAFLVGCGGCSSVG